MPSRIHVCISIPPKYAVSNVMGYLKSRKRRYLARSAEFKYSDLSAIKKPSRVSSNKPLALLEVI